jgi:opacity protein-like surface antigen
MKKTALQAMLVAAGLATAGAAVAQQNVVKLGAVVSPIAAGGLVEYERLLGGSVSVGARYSSITYTFEDGDYEEEGDLKGFDITFRHYWRGDGFRGWYWGAALGRHESDWDWTEGSQRGSGTSELTNVQAMIGYKHFFNPRFFLDAYGLIGNLSGSSKESTGTKETEIGTYVAAGVGLGLAF